MSKQKYLRRSTSTHNLLTLWECKHYSGFKGTLTRYWLYRKESHGLHVQPNLLIVKTDGNIFSAFLKTVWTVGYACFMLSFCAGDLIAYSKTKVALYRMFHEKRSMCWEVISVIVRKKIVLTCIKFWMVIEIELFEHTNTNAL
jgi:hypothetical protein